MNTFNCISCQTIFFNLTSEEIAKCPNCNLDCSISEQKDIQGQNVDFDSYVDSLRNRGGGCDQGSGCCG